MIANYAGIIVRHSLNLNMHGVRGHVPAGNVFNLDPLRSLGMLTFLSILSKFPDFCIAILHKKLDDIFISQANFAWYIF